LKKHRNESEYFYEIRSLDRNREKYEQLTDIERASRIHFLNKTFESFQNNLLSFLLLLLVVYVFC
ncbi:hypothetical protein ACTPEM_25585, partial [Clostridioides difficile]